MGLADWIYRAGMKIYHFTVNPYAPMAVATAATVNTVGNGVSAAHNWAVEKTANGIYAVGDHPGQLAQDAMGTAVNLAMYVSFNPGERDLFIAQGMTNAATSTAGSLVDLGIAGYNNTVIPLYNLGFEEKDMAQKIDHHYASDWRRAGEFITVDPHNPNATSQRIVLYGTEAVTQTGLFIAAPAAGSAALATIRGGSATGTAINAITNVSRLGMATDAANTVYTFVEGATKDAKTGNTILLMEKNISEQEAEILRSLDVLEQNAPSQIAGPESGNNSQLETQLRSLKEAFGEAASPDTGNDATAENISALRAAFGESAAGTSANAPAENAPMIVLNANEPELGQTQSKPKAPAFTP